MQPHRLSFLQLGFVGRVYFSSFPPLIKGKLVSFRHCTQKHDYTYNLGVASHSLSYLSVTLHSAECHHQYITLYGYIKQRIDYRFT